MGDYADEPADYYMRQIIEELTTHNDIQQKILCALLSLDIRLNQIVDVIDDVGSR